MTSRQFKTQAQAILKSHYSLQEIDALCRHLVKTIVEIDNTAYYLQIENDIPSAKEKELQSCLLRLASGEPIQYILGKAAFFGMELHIQPGVLIPRPETEELVQWILDSQRASASKQRIIDIGTGSGCIAIALKKHMPQAHVDALDISSEAKKCCTQNAKEQGVDLRFIEADILAQPHFEKNYTLIVSNPPYVTPSDKSAMQAHVVDHEPALALYVPEEDPLLYYRAICHLAQAHLSNEGKLYVEVNERYGKKVAALLAGNGFKDVEVRQDMQGKDRMVGGTYVLPLLPSGLSAQ